MSNLTVQSYPNDIDKFDFFYLNIRLSTLINNTDIPFVVTEILLISVQ
jgi:hypothetical protein